MYIYSEVLKLSILVRKGTIQDVKEITTIFNQGIEGGVATLETKLQTEKDILAWMKDRDPRYMILVAQEESGKICGYVSLNKFNFKSAYTGVADLSIYIEKDNRGQGIGEILLKQVIEEAKKEGFYKLVINVISKNKKALHFYEKIGFSLAGIYKKQGILQGEWVDAIIMEKFLEP